MKSINKKYLVSSWVITALVIVAIIFLNLLAASLTTKFDLKLDLTRYNQYEISDTTKKIMADLDKDVKVMVMGAETEISPVIKEYLQKYAAMSKKFNLEYIDVYKNQAMLNEYRAKGHNLQTNDIILECGERYKVLNVADMFASTMSVEENTSNYSFALESKLTNGLVVVTGLMNEMTVYFLDGHGENPPQTMTNLFDTLGFEYKSLTLGTNDIPEDAGLVISSVPTADFTLEEIQKIEKFFDRGGNFMVIFSPGMERHERLDSMLKSWGIEPNYDMVLEKNPEKILQEEIAMLTTINTHNITESVISQGLPIVSYYNSSFTLLPTSVYSTEVTTLLQSSDSSIGKVDFKSMSAEFEEGDRQGPLPLAVVAEKYSPATSRLAAIGSIGTLLFAEQNEGNSEFLSGLISWMTNNSNTLSISPQIISESRVEVTNSTLVTLNYLLVWIIPIIILLAGIIIWIRRRYL